MGSPKDILHIWVSGYTSSGKTTLIQRADFFPQCLLVPERVREDSLKEFLRSPAENCFSLQLEIMSSRFVAAKDHKGCVKFDRSISEDFHIFCRMFFEEGFLTRNEFLRLEKEANSMLSHLPEPSLIYFCRPGTALLTNAASREQPNLIFELLDKQIHLYDEWLDLLPKRLPNTKVIVIDHKQTRMGY